MDAPMSPLTDEQAKALAARQVADPGWQPNEVYLTEKDSLLMHGETACQAIDEVHRLRAPVSDREADAPAFIVFWRYADEHPDGEKAGTWKAGGLYGADERSVALAELAWERPALEPGKAILMTLEEAPTDG